MKALVVGNTSAKIDGISAAQLEPFFKERRQLHQELGLTFKAIQAVSISDIEQACKRVDEDVDILLIRPDWREDASEVEKTLKTVRNVNPNRKIIFIDPWDQVSSRFFGVLPYVDWFLKYQRLKDVQQYKQPLLGGTVITDYLAREWGYDLDDWYVGSEIPEGYEHRIATGWNVVTAKRFQRILFKSILWRLKNRKLRKKSKDIDVFCQLGYGSIHDRHNWYTDYRKAAIAALQPLDSNYSLAVKGEYPETKTVSSRQYFDELERSRIVVSPFGWGETTWRDYEAVCNDCLLIKPSVDHIDTAPNIYTPRVTYVPIKWDFSDVQEKCHYYLQNQDEAAQIIKNARRTLENYFKEGEFVKTIGNLIANNPVPSFECKPVSQQKTTFLVG